MLNTSINNRTQTNMREITITTSEQGSLVVSSRDFALGLDIQHKNLIETIRTHQQAIEEGFGLIVFETRKIDEKDSPFETANLATAKRSTKPQTVAYLTEDQALFIGTLSRNSKRVVEFKATLVKSFAQARQRLQPATPTTDQLLIQLMAQTNQLMAAQQELMAGLRADVDELKHTQPAAPAPLPPHRQRQAPRAGQLGLPGIPPPNANPSLRHQIYQHVLTYSGYHGAPIGDTYAYLYRRLFEVYSISVNRLNRLPTESVLDVLDRYGHMDRLYALVQNELIFPHQ